MLGLVLWLLLPSIPVAGQDADTPNPAPSPPAEETEEPEPDPRLPGEVSDKVCLECHGPEKHPNLEKEGRTSELLVEGDRFKKSVHHELECVTCHTKLPHEFGLPRVECGSCHEEEAKQYAESIHGQRLAAGDELAPTCQECHGAHYVLSPHDPNAATAPFNIPGMCARCHAEGAPVERTHDIPQEQIFKRYTQSIHGEGLFRQGLVSTAVCTSCHTAHLVLPHTDTRSSVSRENVVQTCMQCHGLIESVHRKIIRGSLWEKEPHAVPVCVECHSPHEARKVLYDTKMSNADCLLCHGREDIRAGDGRTLFVKESDYAGSVHGRGVVACTQCHTEVSIGAERPCASIESRVNCSICHEQAVSDYEGGIHGRLHAEGDTSAPYCTDCHGTHDILEHAFKPEDPESLKRIVRNSPTFVFNLPQLCAECHREGSEAHERYRGDEHEVVARYEESIHGKGLTESGLTVTATCADCHTAHRELPQTDPRSSVHPDNVAGTCGKCHDGIAERYTASIHSPSTNTSYERGEGMPPLPKCSDCHSSHTIGRTDVAGFELGIMDQCGKCHTDVSLTYFDSYHGKVSKLGETNVAKCHDCHGAHEIRAVDDPLSTLSEANIVETCAACHPGSHQGFTGYVTHANHHDRERYPVFYYAFWGMTGLLVGTFSFFGLHTLLWLPRSWRMRKHARSTAEKVDPKAKQFVRFRRHHRAMHLAMILSSLRCDCGDQLHMAIEMIRQEGTGAVVYLPQEGRGIGLTAKLKAYKLQDDGLDTVEANHRLGFQADLRDYMVGLQILKDLGLTKVRILTNNPKKTEAFEHWVDLKIVDQVPIIAPPDEHRERYLATKRDKLGHRLPKQPD